MFAIQNLQENKRKCKQSKREKKSAHSGHPTPYLFNVNDIHLIDLGDRHVMFCSDCESTLKNNNNRSGSCICKIASKTI